jgi:hypothetical protein
LLNSNCTLLTENLKEWLSRHQNGYESKAFIAVHGVLCDTSLQLGVIYIL